MIIFKNVKRKGLIILSSLIAFTSGYGQQLPKGYTDKPKFIDKLELGRNILVTYNMAPTYEVKGTPYLYEEFQNGELYFKDMTKMSGLKLNYNCTTGDILFIYDDKTYITARDDINYFVIYPTKGDTIFLFNKQLLPEERHPEYLEILYNERSVLFKRHLKTYKEASVKTPYHANRDYNEYVDKEEYCIKLTSNEIVSFKPTKKAVLSLYPEKADMISDFIRNEKIRPKKDTDLIKVIKYSDSL